MRKTTLQRCEERALELEAGAAVELEPGIEGCVPACVWSKDGTRKLAAARGATKSKAAAALLKVIGMTINARALAKQIADGTLHAADCDCGCRAAPAIDEAARRGLKVGEVISERDRAKVRKLHDLDRARGVRGAR